MIIQPSVSETAWQNLATLVVHQKLRPTIQFDGNSFVYNPVHRKAKGLANHLENILYTPFQNNSYDTLGLLPTSFVDRRPIPIQQEDYETFGYPGYPSNPPIRGLYTNWNLQEPLTHRALVFRNLPRVLEVVSRISDYWHLSLRAIRYPTSPQEHLSAFLNALGCGYLYNTLMPIETTYAIPLDELPQFESHPTYTPQYLTKQLPSSIPPELLCPQCNKNKILLGSLFCPTCLKKQQAAPSSKQKKCPFCPNEATLQYAFDATPHDFSAICQICYDKYSPSIASHKVYSINASVLKQQRPCQKCNTEVATIEYWVVPKWKSYACETCFNNMKGHENAKTRAIQ